MWLHAEHGDALIIIVGMAQRLAYLIIYRGIFGIRNHHQALNVLLGADQFEYLAKEITCLGKPFGLVGIDGKLAQMILECLFAQVVSIVSWYEVFHLLLVLLVNQDYLYLVLTLSHAAIECHAVKPLGDICLWNATTNHALEVNNEIKCHSVNVVCIYQYHVVTPLYFIIQFVVHMECKYTNFFAKQQTFRVLFGFLLTYYYL